MRHAAWCLALAFLASACGSDPRPALALGAPAPDFSLKGVDGANHTLAEYAASPVLAVVFTCNHCPAAQLAEAKIQKLSNDYRAKGAAVIAINPENPQDLLDNELSWSDSGESLEDMKARATWRKLTYPYLFAGDARAVSKAFGPSALPQTFVFDRDRKLRYEGGLNGASASIDALLAGQDVKVAHTRAEGCPPDFGPTAPAQKSAD